MKVVVKVEVKVEVKVLVKMKVDRVQQRHVRATDRRIAHLHVCMTYSHAREREREGVVRR